MIVQRSASVKCEQPSPKELIYGDQMRNNFGEGLIVSSLCRQLGLFQSDRATQ
jgi:hypothetical protein